jgi:hypothetical protein
MAPQSGISSGASPSVAGDAPEPRKFCMKVRRVAIRRKQKGWIVPSCQCRNKLLDSSARKFLIDKEADSGLCGLQPFSGGEGGREYRPGESENRPRVLILTMVHSPQTPAPAPANTRHCANKNANGEPLALLYWWRRRESNPRPEALYRQFYILSAAI